jgi:lambda family phage portal protein
MLKPKPSRVDVVPNVLDRLIGYVAPKTAARRMVARQQLAMVGGYNGARLDRSALATMSTRAGGPESDVIVDLPALRARCADLERNSPIGASVINTNVAHVVGTGLACTPQIDGAFLGLSDDEARAWQSATQRRFKAWAESSDCDLARRLNLYGIQDLCLRSTLSRGDVFVVTPVVDRPAGKRLALQVVEADRVCNPNGSADTDTLTAGIEHSLNTGEALRFHIAAKHPGEIRTIGQTWTAVPARGGSTGRRNVLHLFRQLRPGLRRGVPILAPVLEPIKQITRYTEAELQAAVVSGLYALFLRMDPQAFQDLFDDQGRATLLDRSSKWSGEIESGQVVNLLPGEEPVPANPGRPNAEFDPFVTACMRQIGMAIGLPYEVLVMHYQSSYSAARAALLMAWRHWYGWRDWLATGLCQPVYELWLADEVAAGRISAPGFFSDFVVRAAWCGAQWVGDGPGSIDPVKEAKGAAERWSLGITTLQAESLLHDGVDWETKHAQQARELSARKAAGLPIPGQPQYARPVMQTAAPEPDEDDAEDDQAEDNAEDATDSPTED